MRESVKPNITSFLAQYPVPNPSGDEGEKYNHRFNDGTVKLEGGWLGDEAPNQLALDYDGDEESGAVLEPGYSITDMVGKLDVLEPAESLEADSPGMYSRIISLDTCLRYLVAHIPIDPKLISEGIPGDTDQPGGRDWPGEQCGST
jgi:hypothetical protein